MCTVWVKILQHIDDRNVILQTGGLTLEQEMANIEALSEEINLLKNEWDSLLCEARHVAVAIHPNSILGRVLK